MSLLVGCQECICISKHSAHCQKIHLTVLMQSFVSSSHWEEAGMRARLASSTSRLPVRMWSFHGSFTTTNHRLILSVRFPF